MRIATERGAIPDQRGSRAVAGSCTLWWVAERLELECQERVPLVSYHLVGQPAVSADGARIAVSHRPGDGPTARIEVLEFAGVELAAPREGALVAYSLGMERYKQHDWAGAKEHFEAALSADPTDGPSRVYVDRCAVNIAEPPPPDWDFVVRRTKK